MSTYVVKQNNFSLRLINTVRTDLIVIDIDAVVIGIADEAPILTKINVPIHITAALGIAVMFSMAFQ